MAVGSKIEWCGATWNPIVGIDGGWGCNKVSPGCDHCYAEILHKRFGGQGDYGSTEHEFTIKNHILTAPLKRKKPTTYFVCSTMDLFHHNVTNVMIAMLFATMANCPQHRFLILTKRPERMKEIMPDIRSSLLRTMTEGNRLNHIWLGVSAENQKYWDKRVPILMSIPAAVRFVSVEPMLDTVVDPVTDGRYIEGQPNHSLLPDWVIIGGESGPKCRQIDIRHIKYLVLILKEFGIPTFVKQLGGHPDKRNKMEDWPQDLRVREYPAPQVPIKDAPVIDAEKLAEKIDELSGEMFTPIPLNDDASARKKEFVSVICDSIDLNIEWVDGEAEWGVFELKVWMPNPVVNNVWLAEIGSVVDSWAELWFGKSFKLKEDAQRACEKALKRIVTGCTEVGAVAQRKE